MSTLLIENYLSKNIISNLDSPIGRERVRSASGRMIWLAEAGDILLLSRIPDQAYFAYACDLMGVDQKDVEVIVPPPGIMGTDVLTSERLFLPETIGRLSGALAERPGLKQLDAYVVDEAILRIASALGLDDAIPGRDFVAQGGADLLNSKGLFRMMCRQAGIPVADGVVMRNLDEVAYWTEVFLRDTGSVILKRNFHTGGYGNFVFSRSPETRPLGALEAIHATDSTQVREALHRVWPFLSAGGSQPVVVEQYFPGSTTLACELKLTDHDVRWRTQLEMLMNPRIDGFVWRPFGTLESDATFRTHATELAWKVHALGYRGILIVDAIVTPAGEFLLTEFDGRQGGLTHLHSMLTRLVSPAYGNDRHAAVINVPCADVAKAIESLRGDEICFSPREKRGVVLTSGGVDGAGPVESCIIAESADAVREMRDRLVSLLSPGGISEVSAV
jgi:hypothetical protein